MAWEDLRLLLEDLLFGGLEVHEKLVLLFSGTNLGMGGAH